jgi:cellulose synthase operon protein C
MDRKLLLMFNQPPTCVRRILLASVTCAMTLAAGLLPAVYAQTTPPAKKKSALDFPLSPLVDKIINDPITTESEKQQLQLFHGQWDKIEKPTPSQQAAIDLATFALTAKSLAVTNTKTPPLLRAEAALLRGEPEQTLKILKSLKKNNTTNHAQAALLIAQAHEALGDSAAAIEAAAPWRTKVLQGELVTAPQLVAGAQCVVLLAKLEGRPARDYEQAMRILGTARTQVDRLYWPASLAEARVLMDKNNPQAAYEALSHVLSLNPNAGQAWAMMGTFLAQRYEFDICQQVVDKLKLQSKVTRQNHLLAGIVEATMFLTQKDTASARKAVEPLLAIYPNQRELLALLAAIEALSFRDKQMQQVLDHFDKLSGNNPAALIAAGSYLSHARQYPLSEKLLTQAVKRKPNWPGPRIELGLMLMQAGKEVAAMKELRLAAQLDPFNTRARNQLKLVETLLGYDHLETKHFVIKYRAGIDEVLARDMQNQLEYMFQQVTDAFEHKPERKTLIEIMPDEEWFGVRITGLPEIWTIAACTGDVIALTPPRQGPKQRGHYNWFRVLQHEYTHTVTLDQTKYRIPHWFTEAAAVAMEPGGRDYNTHIMLSSALNQSALFDLRTINWGFIRPRKPTDRPLAYAQSHWMFQYITDKFGHKAIIQLQQMFRAGAPDIKAITTVTGQSAEDFMLGFKKWATAQVKTWGLGPQDDDKQIAIKLKNIKTFDDAVLKSLIEFHPDNPTVLKLAADSAMAKYNAGRLPLADARAAVLRYGGARPVDPWAAKALYTLALASDNQNEAIAALNQIDNEEQSTGKWALELAKLYRGKRNYAQAHRAIIGALHREPYNANYRELAASIALQNKDLPGALHQIKALTILEGDRSMHFVRLAAIYSMMGEKQQAKTAAQNARKLNPKAPVEKFLN